MASELFRTALRGFNRTDVVQYIQQQTMEHEKNVRILRDENNLLKQNVEEAEAECQALLSEKRGLQEEVTVLRERLAALEEENAALTETLEAAPRNGGDLDSPIAPSPMLPNSYDEMELTAYRRAELTERMARERALSSAERMKQIFSQSCDKISLLEGDFALILDACRNDFTQMQELLRNARALLGESSDGLRAAQSLCDSL